MDGGNGAILYCFMGRGRTVWADHQASSSLQQPQKTASQMLAKLSKEGKYTFQLSDSRTSFCLVDHLGVVFGCVASSAQLTSTAAMVFLGDLQEQFYCQFGAQEVQTCAENTTQFRRFSLTMKKAMEVSQQVERPLLPSISCRQTKPQHFTTTPPHTLTHLTNMRNRIRQSFFFHAVSLCGFLSSRFAPVATRKIAYSGGSAKIANVKKQIEDTRIIMSENIDKVLERGERLEDVMDKSEQMRDTADAFRKKGRELRRKMWWQNTKMKLIIALVVVVLILLLFFGFCRGISCIKK
uniref:V-SNARE coiled-coil homology domain-containing protein n=1 Tax=Phaeocystis cordata TaxID=118079 RepID=A0A6T5URB3_9EUKA